MGLIRNCGMPGAAFALLALAVSANAVPISGITEQTLAPEMPSKIVGAPVVPEPQAFVPRTRAGSARSWVSSSAPSLSTSLSQSAASSVSIASAELPTPGSAYAEFTSVRFISPSTAYQSAQAAQFGMAGISERGNAISEDPREPSVAFEDSILFLELLREFGVSASWISLDQHGGGRGVFDDATVQADVFAPRMNSGGLGPNAQLDGGNTPMNLEMVRLAVPNVRDQEGVTANIVYLLSILADPYRILVNHPVLVFLGFCFLAFVLSLKRR